MHWVVTSGRTRHAGTQTSTPATLCAFAATCSRQLADDPGSITAGSILAPLNFEPVLRDRARAMNEAESRTAGVVYVAPCKMRAQCDALSIHWTKTPAASRTTVSMKHIEVLYRS